MDIRGLRYFIELVEQQNFTKAANKLFVTQSTISKALINLEAEAGCQLLIRGNKQLQLTDAGELYYKRGLNILSELAQLDAELKDLQQLKAGELRVGIPPMTGIVMSQAIGLFRRSYPNIGLKIEEMGSLKNEEAVLNNRLDVAISFLPTSQPGLCSEQLMSYPIRAVVRHDSPLAQQEAISLEELAEHPLLLHGEDFAISQLLTAYYQTHQIKTHIVGRSGQWDFLAKMVEEKLGIMVLPEPVFKLLDSAELTAIRLSNFIDWQLGLIWKADSYLSYSAQAWMQLCRQFDFPPEVAF